VVSEATALAIVDAFLAAEFVGGRHAMRVDMITAPEL
jgi:ribose 5-phosphate isomerase B